HVAGCQARAVAIEARAANGEELTFVDVFEQLSAGDLDEPYAAAHERQRSRVWKTAGERGGDVDHDAHARLEQLLGRDAVEIGVLDDRDVVGREALDEVLRPPVELRGTR